jgi:hypothetical protein
MGSNRSIWQNRRYAIATACSSYNLDNTNDENFKRAYGSKNDACLVFQKMLESGYPPDDWHDLLAHAQAGIDRLDRAIVKDKLNVNEIDTV